MSAALLDHLWQSTLFAVAICLMVPLFRHNSAAVRFWLWFAASVKFLVPFSIFTLAGRLLLPPHTPAMPERLVSVLKPVAIPFSRDALALPATSHLMLIDLIPAAWLLGTAALLVRWLLRALRLRAHVQEAAALPLSASVPVKSTGSGLEPGLVGIWRPVILLPQGIEETLSSREIEAVMAHELCHLRRRDNLLAAVHMLVEALFWFHPLVWWLGGRLVEERELACDESVLVAGNPPLDYAKGILKVCRIYLQSSLLCASGVSGAALETRIATILSNRVVNEVGEAKRALLVSAALLSVMLPVIAGGIGSAPVSHIASRISSTFLVKAIIPPTARMPGDGTTEHKVATHRRHHAAAPLPVVPGKMNAEPSEPAVAVESKVAASAPVVAVPEPVSTQISSDVSTTAKASSDDSEVIVCRPPQQLPGSHLIGPRVCQSKGEWARLRAEGRDIGADGRIIVDASNGDFRSSYSQACTLSLAAPHSNNGIFCF